MFLRKTGRLLSALAISAVPAFAQGWDALVVGQSGTSAPKAFADAFHAAGALRQRGLDRVTLLRDVRQAGLRDALSALDGASGAILYFSGPLDGDLIRLSDGMVSLTDILQDLSGQGVRQVALLIEDCADPARRSAFVPPAYPDAMEVFLAASGGPGAVCSSVSERLTDTLARADAPGGTSLQVALEQAWFETSLTAPIMLAEAAAPSQPAPAAPVISIVSREPVSIVPVATPVQSAPTLVSIRPTVATPQPRTQGRDSVVVFAPAPTSQVAAIPTALGLPEPSIIVGIIENASLEFDSVVPQEDVTSSEISYDNLAARRDLRANSPDLFAELVASGAFDPPEALLPTALQTELARMGCYTAGIDGIWGGGSRRSVERYFDQIPGVSAVSLDPDIPLFRQIIRQDDIVCPAPVAATRAAPQPAARSSSSTARRQPAATTTRTQTAQPRRQQPAASSGSSSGRTIQRNRLGGVFR